jgi:hypothetical protein
MADTSPFRHLKRGTASEYTLVSDSGESLRLEWYLWMGIRNAAATVGGWRPAGTEQPEGWDATTRGPGGRG